MVLSFILTLIVVVWFADGSIDKVSLFPIGANVSVSLLNKRHTVCIEKGQQEVNIINALAPLQWFLETKVDISIPANADFPFYSFKAKSHDDLHDSVATIIRSNLLKLDSSKHSLHENIDKSSLVRDMLSSCKSPISWNLNWPMSRSAPSDSNCHLTFSSMGTICISLPSASETCSSITIKVSQAQNLRRYFINLVMCQFLLFAAEEFSKYKSFQYLLGIALFTIAGLLILILNSDRMLGFGGLRKNSNRSVVYAVSSSALYVASIIYVLQTTPTTALTEYWELVLTYFTVMGLTGGFVVRWMRSREDTKHFYRIASKWILRTVAIVFGYNSFPSPLTAVLFLSSLSSAWLVRIAFKKLGKKQK